MSQTGQYSIAEASVLNTLTGNTGGAVGPTVGNINIVGGGTVTVTGNPGTNTLTITDASGALSWNEVTIVGPTGMAVANGYITNNAAQVSVLLPAAAAQGSLVRVTGKGAGGWKITQNAGQSISTTGATTTVGTGGSLASTGQFDTVELLCVTANTAWNILSSMGNITVV